MSTEIDNFRKAVERFDELLVELEIVDSRLSTGLDNYKNVDNNIDKNMISQKEIIDNINKMQKKANNIIDRIDTLNINTEMINDNTVKVIKKEFGNFDNTIKTTMSNAINSIDLKIFQTQIEGLFASKINTLKNEIKKLEITNVKLKNIKNNMNNSIDDINKISKVVNWKIIVSNVFGGFFFGAIAMSVYGLPLLKKAVFKNEIAAKQKYISERKELKQFYSNSAGVQKFLNQNHISINYGRFTNAKNIPYIAFKKNQLSKIYKIYSSQGHEYIPFAIKK